MKNPNGNSGADPIFRKNTSPTGSKKGQKCDPVNLNGGEIAFFESSAAERIYREKGQKCDAVNLNGGEIAFFESSAAERIYREKGQKRNANFNSNEEKLTTVVVV
jgi:hypothetical protein